MVSTYNFGSVYMFYLILQDLNISVDYYGNVKLSIQGLPLGSQDGKSILLMLCYVVCFSSSKQCCATVGPPAKRHLFRSEDHYYPTYIYTYWVVSSPPPPFVGVGEGVGVVS